VTIQEMKISFTIFDPVGEMVWHFVLLFIVTGQTSWTTLNYLRFFCVTETFVESLNCMSIFFLQDNPRENLNLAFDIAERYLDIPKMLDAEGMIVFQII